MDESEKEHLVEQFRSYLEQQNCQQEFANEDGAPDLFSFYSELIALKNEVKIESRLVKNSQDEFRGAISLIGENSQNICDKFESNDKNSALGLEKAIMRPVLTGLLDIHDRLSAARQAGRQHKPSSISFFCRQERAVIASMIEGQEMTLNRIDELLAGFGVRPIDTVGRPFDPHTMLAIATDTDPQSEDGSVSAELRKGFVWKDELLRLAEVKVNRIEQ